MEITKNWLSFKLILINISCMKIFVFVESLNTKIERLYEFFKTSEINKAISLIKKKFSNQNIEIQLFFLTEKKLANFENAKNVNLIINEYLKIDRADYKKINNNYWSKSRKIYKNLLKSDFNRLNYIWYLLESKIKYYFNFLYESIEFIISLISRENPDVIIFLQDNDLLCRFIKNKFKSKEFYFIKSKIDSFFIKLDKIKKIFLLFLFNIKNLILNYFKKTKTKDNIFLEGQETIGIILPRMYLYKGVAPILNSLKEIAPNIKIIKPEFFEYQTTYHNFKFRYIIAIKAWLRLRKYFKKDNIKNMITQYIDLHWKNLYYDILKKVFFSDIDEIIYWHYLIENEIRNTNYSLIIHSNEYFPQVKIWVFICKKYHILSCFIPHVGIPNNGIMITPFYSNVIFVDGEIEKDFLVKNGVNQEKIIVQGSPKYERVMNKEIHPLNQIKDHFTGKVHSISQDKFKILLATNFFSKESNQITLTAVVNAIKKLKNIQFVIKLHPLQTGKFIKNILRELNCDAIIVRNVDIFEIIKTADIFLTEESSVILDSMIVGTPLICLDFSNKRLHLSGIHLYNNEKYILKVYNENELYNYLNLYLRNSEEYNNYKNNLRQNLKKIFYVREGYSSLSYIITVLKKILEDKKKLV